MTFARFLPLLRQVQAALARRRAARPAFMQSTLHGGPALLVHSRTLTGRAAIAVVNAIPGGYVVPIHYCSTAHARRCDSHPIYAFREVGFTWLQ